MKKAIKNIPDREKAIIPVNEELNCDNLALHAHALAAATESMLADESFRAIFTIAGCQGVIYQGKMLSVPLANLKRELNQYYQKRKLAYSIP